MRETAAYKFILIVLIFYDWETLIKLLLSILIVNQVDVVLNLLHVGTWRLVVIDMDGCKVVFLILLLVDHLEIVHYVIFKLMLIIF